MTTLLGDGLSDWVDPGAVRTMVDSVRDGFSAAPVWARIGLLVMLAFAVVTGVLRFAFTAAGRVVALAVIAVGVGSVFWGPAAMDVLSQWWP